MGGPRTSVGRLAAAALVVLAASGCGGEGADESEAGSTTTATGSASTSPSPGAGESVSGLPEPTASVEPATGPRLDVDGIRVRAPEGWKKSFDTVVVDTARGSEGGLMLSVTTTGTRTLSLAQSERFFWTRGQRPPHYERQDDTVLGEVSARHYTWHDRFDTYHAVTAWDAGYVIKVELDTDRSVPQERQQELLDAIVASFEGPRS